MKYCLLGEKLSHSYSSDIHKYLGIDYSLCEIDESELSSFCQNCEYDGFNVTIPYKEKIIPYLSEISDEAKEIGSVNTVLKREGKLYGFNTDYLGMDDAFKKSNVKVKGKNIVILGSGGTSKTAQYYFKKNGAKKITIVSRSGKVNYNNIYENINDCEILVNATPVGMFPNANESLIDLSKLNCLQFVFDLIYNPFKTKLLYSAEKLKINHSNGLDMLIFQAIFAEKIWGFNVESKKTKEVKKYITNKNCNIVLYGMPSSGKSVIGYLLAKKLNKSFFDSDDEIEKSFKKTPKQIIEEYGEEKFREYESQIIEKLSKEKGAVISLGGGSVLREKNVELLKQNGFFVYIKRKLSFLVDKNRPLSKEVGIKKLYNNRKILYNSIYNIEIRNNKKIENAVKRIISKYENSCD